MDLVSALGHCSIHRIDMMSVTDSSGNSTLICVKCRAAGEEKTGRTQIVEDPGEGFNGFTGGKAKVTILDAAHGATPKGPAFPAGRVQAGLTLEIIVERAVSELGNLPMPKDIKQFKKVQKVIKTLQSLVESQNG